MVPTSIPLVMSGTFSIFQNTASYDFLITYHHHHFPSCLCFITIFSCSIPLLSIIFYVSYLLRQEKHKRTTHTHSHTHHEIQWPKTMIYFVLYGYKKREPDQLVAIVRLGSDLLYVFIWEQQFLGEIFTVMAET